MCDNDGVWQDVTGNVVLAPDEVHVWRVSLGPASADVEGMLSLLDEEEKARADRFRFQRDRVRFVVAHAALRRILSHYLQRPPAVLSFRQNQYGKPSLTGPDDWLHFNLSHSGGLALVAVAAGGPVGVDVEVMRDDFGGEAIARRFFSPSEVEALFSLPQEQRTPAFFLCWTRKEAFIKAVGKGVSFPLDGFAVSLQPDRPARVLWVQDDPQEAERWTLVDLAPGPGYAGALALRWQPQRVCLWKWKTPR